MFLWSHFVDVGSPEAETIGFWREKRTYQKSGEMYSELLETSRKQTNNLAKNVEMSVSFLFALLVEEKKEDWNVSDFFFIFFIFFFF